MINAEIIMLYAIPVFFLLIGIELLAGIWMQRQFYRFSDALANISCGITQQVTGAMLKLLGLGLYLFLYHNARIMDIPNNWMSYVLLFLLIDMLYYWFHRYSHEINTFWGAHVVHHQSEEYNLSVALRQSAFQGLFSSVFYLPLAILGFDPLPFAIINTFQTLYQFWIHTEAIGKMPFWFEYFFNTPSHHRVHHGRNPQYIDKNHGGTLIIFDRLFGTFEPEKAPVVYGVTKPLASWNPVWANFDYYADLLKDSARIPRFVDKLRLWVDRPGWLPTELGGQQLVPECSPETEQKYNTPVPKKLIWYALVNFSTVLIGATGFLMMVTKLELYQSIFLAVIIIWTVGNIGGLLDRKKWGIPSEIIRLITIAATFIYLVLAQ
jgi:alkylglycerol monooxygenase